MLDSLITHLKIAKKEAGLTYQDIADLSDGRVSKRTVERIFSGKSQITPERYELLEKALGVSRFYAGALQGPSNILHLVINEVNHLPREQQMLVLQLCRTLNKNKQ